ncbi:MAG: SRPBCC family protein [Cyclobacteriaceae bacterium]|nr:SRPBCC family protein [Cyclobacteriaceae bacterium]
MKTSLDKSFEVANTPEVVWEHLVDPYKIVECVPGVKLTEKVSETEYKGDVGLKLGPVNAAFNGVITYDKVDAATREMILTGKGVDKKGKGSAEMSLTMKVVAIDNGTRVDTIMDVNVMGVIAQFGSRLIADVSDHIFKQFVDNFKTLLAGQQIDSSKKEVNAGSMAGTVVKSMVKNLFKK